MEAGLAAGLINAVFLGVVIMAFGIERVANDLGLLGFLGSALFSTIMLFPLVGLLGLVGGALAGSLRS